MFNITELIDASHNGCDHLETIYISDMEQRYPKNILIFCYHTI